MDGLVAIVVLVLLGLGVVLLVLPIVALGAANAARRKADHLEQQLAELRSQLERREAALVSPAPPPSPVPVAEALAAAPEPAGPPPSPPPVSPPAPVREAAPAPVPAPAPPGSPSPGIAAPLGGKPAVRRQPFQLEQFMGVKLFAWVGGLALFLGILFFVKLSIERGWISEELRTALGFLAGLGLVIGGTVLHGRERYAVLAQSLCATGVVVLYGMSYVAHAYYRFPVLASPAAGLGLMSLITVAAILLAVRMRAMVVVILGMLGGFLTPWVCASGEDHPLGYFGYLALLDLGVLAVAQRRRWPVLAALAAAGTVLSQLGWAAAFFVREGYAEGAKSWVVAVVFLGFAGLFTGAVWRERRGGGEEEKGFWWSGAALALCGSALVAGFALLAPAGTATRPLLVYALVFLADLLVLAVVWARPRLAPAQPAAAGVVFLHLLLWTERWLTAERLPAALAAYLIFGLVQTAFAVVWRRRHPETFPAAAGWVPVAAVLLFLPAVAALDSVSYALWPALLLVDLGVLALVALGGGLWPAAAALVLTLLTVGAWLLRIPRDAPAELPGFLAVLLGFAAVFGAASLILQRRGPGLLAGGADGAQRRWASEGLPVASAVLPFLLLMMAAGSLPDADPGLIFGAAFLLAGFLLGLVRIGGVAALAPLALGCVVAVGAVWQARHSGSYGRAVPLAWHLGFHALFAAFPFVFRRAFAARSLPWAAAALSGVGVFGLVYLLVRPVLPEAWRGALAAAFALPPLLSLLAVLRWQERESPARLGQLAWFGGVTLFFITLVFPLQFDRQWLTVAWALEGAALCWFYRRVPHPGLRLAGAGLLVVAFVRLALNPAVLAYAIPRGLPILNWHLYAYGVTAAALFVAARWLAAPRDRLGRISLPALFYTLGGILLFLLLNIEIADFFTPRGEAAIAFQFSGNFARDMTYSIAWALFALALLVIGFRLRARAPRYAGIACLAVTLLKLFLHDLANIGNVYRIGALMAVALVALAASFLYQRFLDRDDPSSGS